MIINHTISITEQFDLYKAGTTETGKIFPYTVVTPNKATPNKAKIALFDQKSEDKWAKNGLISQK